MTKKLSLFVNLFTYSLVYLLISQLYILKATAANYDYLLQDSTIDVFSEESLQGETLRTQGLTLKKSYLVETSNDLLSVTLLETIVDFGIISPLSPVTRSQELEIKGTPGIRYSAFGFKQTPFLIKETKNSIPDTSCDDGLCNDKTAYLWINALTYGLGFRCDNLKQSDCSADFNQADYYRKIVNWIPTFAGMTKRGNGGDSKGLLRGESLLNEPFLKGILSLNPTKARLTYKINVAKAQAKGLYQTDILYIVMPNF